MFRAVFLSFILCLAMVLPYLPGRFDASAATFSFLVQVAGYFGLLMVPVGLAWIINPPRSRLWQQLMLILTGLVALAVSIAAVAVNQLSMGVILGVGILMLLRAAYRRSRADMETVSTCRSTVAVCLVCVPLIVVSFRTMVLPVAADWSRDVAIEHSSPLTTEVESFRQRRGHYPVSLQSLNRDIPTGVVGIERFQYEPSGEAYNLFFVRPHVQLDAREVVMFNPRDEQRFTSHELDLLQYEGEQLDLRRGDRRRSKLAQPHWVSILFD